MMSVLHKVLRAPLVIGFRLAAALALAAAAARADDCTELLDRPWRGLTCFQCLHEAAPGNSAPIVDVLRTSCLKRVMIAFVVDGSFGWKAGEIESAVQALRANGQEVWLHLYIFNGPAQRRWQSGVFHSFAVMNPFSFRYAILENRKTRASFRAIVRERAVPALRAAVALGATVSVAPGLEDNLDDASFRAALRLLQASVPEALTPQYVRNPCFRCQVGNGRSLPQGLLYEEHDDQLFDRVTNGIINSDGRYFRFSTESSEDPTLEDLQESWLGQAALLNNAFLLWVPHYQDAPKGVLPRPLSQRNFRGPTDSEREELVTFLRY